MTTPFVTINIDGPPTIHQRMTVADLLNAAKTLEQWALSLPVNPPSEPEPMPPIEKWDK